MFVILSKNMKKNQKRWKKLCELLAIIFTLFTKYEYITYFHMKNACQTAIVNNKRCTLHMPNYLMINIFFIPSVNMICFYTGSCWSDCEFQSVLICVKIQFKLQSHHQKLHVFNEYHQMANLNAVHDAVLHPYIFFLSSCYFGAMAVLISEFYCFNACFKHAGLT